jgi:phosphatidyl-myo-inositol dimannoside synthase
VTRTLAVARVFPPQVGGSGRWMWDLYSRMPSGEFVVAAGRSPGCESFDRDQELKIERMDLQLPSWGAFGLRRSVAYLAAYQQLCEIVYRHDVEAVHAACCLPEGFLAWMLRRRFGLPYLVYVHGEELNVAGTSRELSWLTRRALRSAELVIANSQNTADILRERWQTPLERVRVLHPGVDATRFRPMPRDVATRARLGWGSRRVILSVGRLQKRKGYAKLIKALPEIIRSVPDVLYAIIGAGDERETLDRLVEELGVAKHVLFHDELRHENLIEAYQQCDLFALPNIEVAGDIEGFGIVLLEAQACGRPVVAGRSGGTAETMRDGETGVIVDCRDVPVLTATVRELLCDDLRREQMGEAAHRWIIARFDWNVLCPTALRTFGELTGTRVASADVLHR